MLLKFVDRLVKEGNHAEALRLLARASEEEPRNPYIKAYEARIRALMEQPRPSGSEGPEPVSMRTSPPPSGEHPPIQHEEAPDQIHTAIRSKVAEIIARANEYLHAGDFERAIEEAGRAQLLDEENPEIRRLKGRIREARQDAERFAETERARLAREQEEATRKELEELRRQEEMRQAQEELARREAHERKLNESLSRCRAMLSAGRLQEARNDLAFAQVLDPNNHLARQLEQEITRAQSQALHAQLRRQQEEEEQRARALEDLRVKIQAAAEEARAAAGRGEFVGALDIITRAFTLDPMSQVLQAAESEITAARDEALERERELRLARKREEERHQREELKRKAEEERRTLLRQRESAEEARKAAARLEVVQHHERAREFLAHSNFEAALAEVALAFMVDPFNAPTRELEQEILRAQEGAREMAGTPGMSPPETSAVPHAIDAHIEEAREYAARREFARAFDSIARAYAVDPLHPAVQECERAVQAAFVEYQGLVDRSDVRKRGHRPARPAGDGAAIAGASHARKDGKAVVTFDDFAPAKAPPPPALQVESIVTVPFYRRRPVMYGGGVGALLMSAAVFLISSPSGEKPEHTDQAAGGTGATEQVVTMEPPSAPVTLSEPPILPGEMVAESGPGSPVIPAKLQWEEPVSEMHEENGRAPDSGRIATAGGQPDQPAGSDTPDTVTAASDSDPPVQPGPAAAGAPRAPEVSRLQEPRIPDAILASGITGDVDVLVEIDADGRPVSARVTRSTIPALDHLIIEAVMASEFRPGVSSTGQTTTSLAMTFRVGG